MPAGTPPRIRTLLERCLRKDARRRLREIGDALHRDSRKLAAGPGTTAYRTGHDRTRGGRQNNPFSGHSAAGQRRGQSQTWSTSAKGSPRASFNSLSQLPKLEGHQTPERRAITAGRAVAVIHRTIEEGNWRVRAVLTGKVLQIRLDRLVRYQDSKLPWYRSFRWGARWCEAHSIANWTIFFRSRGGDLTGDCGGGCACT